MPRAVSNSRILAKSFTSQANIQGTLCKDWIGMGMQQIKVALWWQQELQPTAATVKRQKYDWVMVRIHHVPISAG